VHFPPPYFLLLIKAVRLPPPPFFLPFSPEEKVRDDGLSLPFLFFLVSLPPATSPTTEDRYFLPFPFFLSRAVEADRRASTFSSLWFSRAAVADVLPNGLLFFRPSLPCLPGGRPPFGRSSPASTVRRAGDGRLPLFFSSDMDGLQAWDQPPFSRPRYVQGIREA